MRRMMLHVPKVLAPEPWLTVEAVAAALAREEAPT